MKQIYAILAVMLLSVGLLAGCGGQEKAADSGKHLSAALYWFGESVDPAHEWDGWTVTRIGAGETLITVSDKMEFTPQLADKWEATSPTTWRFHIRENVKFQDGTPMTPELVKASLERTLKESTRSQKSSKIKEIKVEGQDLVVETTEPHGSLLAALTEPAFVILNTKADLSNVASAPVLTGPYQIVGFKKGEEIQLKRNEYYWDGTPGLDTLTVKNLEDDNKRAMALQSGDVNLIQRCNSANRSLFENGSYKIDEIVGVRVYMLRMNFDGVLKDTNLRRVVSYAVNYDDLAKIEGNGAVVAGAPFPPNIGPKYQESLREHMDLAKAEELLKAAGYTEKNAEGYVTKDGKPLELTINVWGSKTELYEAVQNQLQKAGIKVNLRRVQNSEEAKTKRDFDLTESNWITMGTNDPYWYMDQTLRSTSPENVGHYANPEVDKLLDAMVTAADAKQRMELAGKIQDLVLQDVPNLYLVCPTNQVVAQSNVKGVVVHPIDYYLITKDLTVDGK